MNAGLYEVVGPVAYRGHQPGSRFVARLEPAAERRAIDRHNIRKIKTIVPSLQPGSYRLPNGWLTPRAEEARTS